MIQTKLIGAGKLKDIDINLFFNNQIKNIVKMIQDDITKNITDERIVTEDIGGAYADPAALSKKYKEWKVRKGYPPNIFRMKERLLKSVKNKKVSNGVYRIYISGKANDYAEHVNEKRKFFGISKNIIDDIEKYFKISKLNNA